MQQFNIRVEEKIGQSFREFCKGQEITPYELLNAIVGFYGRGELVTEGLKKKTLSQEESLIELGRIVKDMQKFAQANGEFLKAVAALLEPYGIKLSNLWPSWQETGEKIPA
ncbi:MAG: hypothetical protein HWN68_08250 [Desulfobacterales bacterium]|nr:hypothetical protein [Desulfobacterales bacterium]